MEDRQTAPKKYYRVLDCEYDEDKNIYTTESINENRKKKFKIRNLFRRKNLKTF